MLHYMQQFGSANNFSGQIGKRALKSMVKDHAQQTQRQVNVFASQCADREYESTVYIMPTMILNIFWAQRRKLRQMLTQ